MKTVISMRSGCTSPVALAVAIVEHTYGLTSTADAVEEFKRALGLGEPNAHVVENAFSYPDGVALLRDSRGRASIYLFDSNQEKPTVGQTFRELDPETPVAASLPEVDGQIDKAASPALPDSQAQVQPPIGATPPASPDLPPIVPAADLPAIQPVIETPAETPPLATPAPGTLAPADAPDPKLAADEIGTSDGSATPASTPPVAIPVDPAPALGEPVVLDDATRKELSKNAIEPGEQGTALGQGDASTGIPPQPIDTAPVGDGQTLPAVGADPRSEGVAAAWGDNASAESNPYSPSEQTDAFDAWQAGFREGVDQKGRPIAKE